MEIQDIDHVVLHVDDAAAAAASLAENYGFRPVGRSAAGAELTSVLMRQGDIRLLLTSTRETSHPARQFVDRHGEGVGVIAFATPDARSAFAEAVQRGGAPVQPPVEYADGPCRLVVAEVGGTGDVTHRLVERHGPTRDFFPGVALTDSDGAPPADEMLRELDHVAIAVPAGELAPTVQMYHDVFGLQQIFAEHIEVGRQGMDSAVVQNDAGGVTFTLLEPAAGADPGQIDTFLARHGGAGVQHLAYRTDDIVTTVTALGERGVRFLATPGTYYDDLAGRLGHLDVEVRALREIDVLVDRDHWGEMFQIFARSTHERGTYFTEIIDRHGARTFGSGNIKALYAAVERGARNTADI